MKAEKLTIPEVILFEPKVFTDNRGFFFESFSHAKFEEAIGHKISFVQDNHSCSHKGTLRGLHYQLNPKAQGKLVRVIRGEIFDVAVDIRKSSPTFGKWVSAILSAENKKQLWIPAGFIHGFLALTDNTEVIYKATDYYAPEYERGILWSDTELDIKWPEIDSELYISDKDAAGVSLAEAEVFE